MISIEYGTLIECYKIKYRRKQQQNSTAQQKVSIEHESKGTKNTFKTKRAKEK